MTELCEIPLERLRSPDDEYEEFYYHWVDVRQTYWLRRPGLVDKLIAAIPLPPMPCIARRRSARVLDALGRFGNVGHLPAVVGGRGAVPGVAS
ncbi:Imm49 family immunity protein [Streptomyces sp. NPDC058304]|uniref:Imm49 family immunity protein n=1 Tax=Streptomyces sp. NPDC058304 TaxID=3346437 RepID=UPI0036E6AD81